MRTRQQGAGRFRRATAAGRTVLALAITAGAVFCRTHAAAQIAGEAARCVRVAVRVADASTGKPVVGAAVSVRAGGGAFQTDTLGNATVVDLPAGGLEVRIVALGYADSTIPVKCGADGRSDVEVRLNPAPLVLNPLSVAARRQYAYLRGLGFFERERSGGGTFVSGQRLEDLQQRSSYLTDALRQAAGFAVRPTRRGSGQEVVSTRGENSILLSCRPQVYIDGIPYATNLSRDFNDILPLGDVVGIEAYPGSAFAPPQYGKHPCGTILIWTRHGR